MLKQIKNKVYTSHGIWSPRIRIPIYSLQGLNCIKIVKVLDKFEGGVRLSALPLTFLTKSDPADVI